MTRINQSYFSFSWMIKPKDKPVVDACVCYFVSSHLSFIFCMRYCDLFSALLSAIFDPVLIPKEKWKTVNFEVGLISKYKWENKSSGKVAQNVSSMFSLLALLFFRLCYKCYKSFMFVYCFKLSFMPKIRFTCF